MAAETEISWCDSTFNPFIGCTKVSPGCDNCYAEHLMDHRMHKVVWGPGQPRVRTSAANWKKPIQWNRDAAAFQAQHGRRQRVFCASLADVFDNEVPQQWRTDLFNLMLSTPSLDWLLLTKRIGNAARMIDETLPANMKTLPPDCPVSWPWPHVWIGATIVNQEEADRDIPKLLAVPACVRFLSMEPLLGPVDLRRHLLKCCGCPEPGHPGDGWMQPPDPPTCCGNPEPTDLHWVIVGGESGPGARPMHPEWARSLRDQCAAAGVPLHYKQHGEWIAISQQGAGDGPGCSDYPPYKKAPRCVLQLDGRVAEEWPPGAMTMLRIGKKAAGRLLDGVKHEAFPDVP